MRNPNTWGLWFITREWKLCYTSSCRCPKPHNRNLRTLNLRFSILNFAPIPSTMSEFRGCAPDVVPLWRCSCLDYEPDLELWGIGLSGFTLRGQFPTDSCHVGFACRSILFSGTRVQSLTPSLAYLASSCFKVHILVARANS